MSEKGNWALKGQERSVMCFSFAVFSGGGKTGSLRSGQGRIWSNSLGILSARDR